MIGPVDNSYQNNFQSNKLLPGTENFFNTKAFAESEIKFLGTMIHNEQEAQERGIEAIKKSIEGES